MFFYKGYSKCKAANYLSLKTEHDPISSTTLCNNVLISIDSTFYLDNSGYWDTKFEWAFAETMLSTSFVGFSTTVSTWENKLSPNIYAQFEKWNVRWTKQATAYNLMSMVVAEKNVGEDPKSLLLARVLADPKSLMNSNYKVSHFNLFSRLHYVIIVILSIFLSFVCGF